MTVLEMERRTSSLMDLIAIFPDSFSSLATVTSVVGVPEKPISFSGLMASVQCTYGVYLIQCARVVKSSRPSPKPPFPLCTSHFSSPSMSS